jgi:predicted transcriptional regulator
MIRLCREAGLPEPSFSISDGFVATLYRPVASNPPSDLNPRNQVGTKSGLSRDQVDILHKCQIESSLLELMKLSGKTNRTKFRDQVLKPLLVEGFVELTIPDKPTSSKQRYRLTAKGCQFLEAQGEAGEER